jgi:hypothetical protein
MTTAICIPVWGRHELAERVIDYYRARRERYGLSIILGASEPLPYATDDCKVVFTENSPLSAKFNNTIEGARDHDGVMVVGSDNIIHDDYFEWIAANKPVFSELGSCYYFEQATGEMLLHWRAVLGAGKYMSREMLQRCSYRPYAEDLDRNVDGGPKRFVRQGECHHLTTVNWAIDVKTPEENMWDFDYIRTKYRNTENAEAKGVFNAFNLDVNDWLVK